MRLTLIPGVLFRLKFAASNEGRTAFSASYFQGISMFDSSMTIAGFDDALFSAIQDEERRQEEHIELIASENYASPRVMQAQGTVLTNKYAEGYPG